MSNRLFNPKYLKAHYRLNGVTDDYTGQNPAGVWTGTEQYSKNRLGKTCADLVNSYIDLGNSSSLEFTTNFTFSFSVVLNELTGYIISKRGDTGSISGFNVLMLNNKLNIVDPNLSVNELTGFTPTTGREYFFTFCVGTTDVDVYIDGYLFNTVNMTSQFSTASGINVLLSTRVNDTVTRLDQCMSNLIFHNIKLTPSEVVVLYRRMSIPPSQIPVKFPILQLPDKTDPSLVGAWLNKKTAGTPNDYSSNGNNGEDTDIVFKSEGGGGFNGSTSKIIKSGGIDLSSGGSMTAWFKADTLSGTTERVILGTATSNFNRFAIGISEGNNFATTRYDGSFYTASELVEEDKWYFGVLVWNGSEIRGYLNANEMNGPNIMAPSDASEIIIGFRAASGYLPFEGEIRDARIYTRILPAIEIEAIYRHGVPDADLVLHSFIHDNKDLSANNVAITTTNVTLGKGGVFTNGSATWTAQTFITQVYSYRESNGALSRYLYNGIETYKNGVAGATLPLTVTSTGFTGFTGEIHNLKLINRQLSESEVQQDYLYNRKFW